VRAALHDPRLGSADAAAVGPGALDDARVASAARAHGGLALPFLEQALASIERLRGSWLVLTDPPDHTRIRAVVKRALGPRMARIRPEVEATAGELLEAARSGRPVDLAQAVCAPLPALTMARLIGVPAAHQRHFRRWYADGETLFGQDVRLQGVVASAEVIQYFARLIAERRRRPADDLITDLVAARDERGELTEEELHASCVLLLLAGYTTTERLLAEGTAHLLADQERLNGLASDGERRWNAVEELLRFVSPVVQRRRYARADVEIGGCTIRRGERVELHLAAANRDPGEFSSPDELDLTRRPNTHLAFGSGPHLCLGAPLARLEAEVLLAALAADPPRPEAAPADLPSGRQRSGLAPLWVRF
jgi:cytochrome P450